MDSYKTRRLNREVAAHYTFLHENLFDMNHQFRHCKQMGTIKARCLGRRQGSDWAEVDYTFSRTYGTSSIGESAILGVVRKRGDGDNRDLMTIRTEYPYQHLRVWVGDGTPVLNVWLGYIPLDKEQRSTRVFGYLSVKRPRVPGLIDMAWPFITIFTEKIFREDKEIMELEQAAHDAQGCDWNNEVFPPINDLREVLARCGVANGGAATDMTELGIQRHGRESTIQRKASRYNEAVASPIRHGTTQSQRIDGELGDPIAGDGHRRGSPSQFESGPA